MILAHASVSVPRYWDGLATFQRVVSTWSRVAPSLMPEVADDHEPVRRAFDATNLQGALAAWDSRLWIFRRKKPSLRGTFLGSYGHTNSTAHFTLTNPRDAGRNYGDLEALSLALADEFEADLAIVHSLTQPEAEAAISSGRPDVYVINASTMRLGMSTGFSKQLAEGLPTLYWTTYFGDRYVNVIGESRLRAAPWAQLEDRNSGLVARVTSDPPDEATWDAFDTARQRIVDFLGRDLFWPQGHRAPTFGSPTRDIRP